MSIVYGLLIAATIPVVVYFVFKFGRYGWLQGQNLFDREQQPSSKESEECIVTGKQIGRAHV